MKLVTRYIGYLYDSIGYSYGNLANFVANSIVNSSDVLVLYLEVISVKAMEEQNIRLKCVLKR